MKEDFYKTIFFQISFLMMIITQIKSEEEALVSGRRWEDRENEDEDDHPDMMKLLDELKEDIQSLNKDIAKYDTLIYMLLPVSFLLFLIIVGFSIYEMIKCCKKKEGDLIETTKTGNYLYSENMNNSKLKNSSTDSSSSRQSQKEEIKNSFHSSKVTESVVSKDVLKSDVFNSRREKGTEIKSNNINLNNSGYVAPSIEEIKENNQENDDEEGKFLTNKGDEDPGKKNDNLMSNPFVK